MVVLLAIALKSVIVAGAALGLLALMKRRSAAERSWVAHVGLVALVLLALAPLVLPSWNVEAPAILGEAPTPLPAASSSPADARPTEASVVAAAEQPAAVSISSGALATAAYALPAAVLLFVTFLALARLIALRARAEVLVDGHWLSALARAQRRMGFKHGTALLTSNDLASPISWGLMRPVILLNSRAVEASGEAEAIIAHELAHIARMDWVKLLLARVATALFWFNPLVWMLAREAHQLREEAADDAVLGADIPDTDYAQLLVGVARHDCPGMLLGAHGVAPSKSSLARRVARVLDGASARGPVARSFAAGVMAGAVLVAAPLAALTLTPGGQSEAVQLAQASGSEATEPTGPYYVGSPPRADLASIIADGVTTSVSTAVAAASAGQIAVDGWEIYESDAEQAREDARERRLDAAERARDHADRIRDAAERARENAEQAREGIQHAQEGVKHAREALRDSGIDRIIAIKAMGLSPEYVTAMRQAAPRLARLDASDFTALKAVGVTPDYARDMVAAGFRNIDDGELTEARAVGITGKYIREMRAAGVNASLDDFVELFAVGVRPDYVRSLRGSGMVFRNADQLVEMQALGVNARDLKARRPPATPRVPPPGWDPLRDSDPDGG